MVRVAPGRRRRFGRRYEILDDRRYRILRDEAQIRADVQRIAGELLEIARDRVPVMIGLLKGSFVFLADLIRAYGRPQEVDFLSMTRYDPVRKDPGSVRVLHDLATPIAGRLVIVVEGIRTRGTKVEYIHRFLQLHAPEEILYCALVRHRGSKGGAVPLHSWGFEIDDDQYVVGYGLDLDERHRSLPFVGLIEPTVGGIEPTDRVGDGR